MIEPGYPHLSEYKGTQSEDRVAAATTREGDVELAVQFASLTILDKQETIRGYMYHHEHGTVPGASVTLTCHRTLVVYR
jgi:hypothetical protein